MSRSRHKDKTIEAALSYAESRGWTVKAASGHAWGRLYCPFNDERCRCGEFCIASIWSTPRNADNHAKQLRRIVDHCVGMLPAEGEDKE